MKPIAITDFASYKLLSQLSFSPNGENAAIVVAQGSINDNNYKRFIYVYNTASKKFKKLTAGGNEGSFVWQDDTHIIFQRINKPEHKKRIESGEELSVFYSIDIAGGEAEELFILPIKAYALQKIDATNYLVSALHNLEYPDMAGKTEEQKAKALTAFKSNADFQVADELPFWFNGRGFINKNRSRLYIYNTLAKKLTAVTTPNFDVSSALVSECGEKVVFIGAEREKVNKQRDGVYVYTIETGKVETLVKSGEYSISIGSFLKDNVMLFMQKQKDDYDFAPTELYSLNIKTKKLTREHILNDDLGCATSSDCRLGGGRIVKSCGENLYFISSWNNTSHLTMWNKKDGIKHITNQDIVVEMFDISNDGCLCIGQIKAPQEIYAVDLKTGAHKQVSSFNTRALSGKYVAQPEPLSFKNKAGVTIDGWVLAPINYDAKKKYPAILEMHGGPRGNYGTAFCHEMQVSASDGCFVFFSNPRGSSSHGEEFANICGKWGTIDYEDLMEFTDEVLKKYPAIDEKRLGVAGGSYGGYMTNWIIGQTTRFAAAASQRSIANWGAFLMIGDILYVGKLQQQADLWTDHKKMWDNSPLKYANRAKTPTLFIHSFEDYRCWYPEAQQMYRALLDQKVETKICMFKGENHELSRSGAPKHRVRRLEEITNWLYTYLKPEKTN